MKDYIQLTAQYKDKRILLNPLLIKQQKVDNVGIEKLKEIHIERMKLEEQMENTNDPILLHKFAQKREQIEYRLQKVWGFPEDSNYHRWWEVPKCTCPRLDNLDNYPTKYRNIDLQCPVHGKLPEKTSLFKRILKFLKIK